MLIVRKAEIIHQYHVSPICPKCNSDMVRSAPDDSLVIDSKTGIQIGCKYAYRCVSCGNIETTEHSYPFTEVKLDLSGAEYTPEEEYYRANG